MAKTDSVFVRLPDGLSDQLRTFCDDHGITYSDFIRALIELYFEDEPSSLDIARKLAREYAEKRISEGKGGKK